MTTAYARLPLNALRVFEAVASRLSFADAAEALHVTPAAVSQQIKSLEDYLQVQLFKRAGRRIELTAEGQQFYERSLRVLADMDEAERAATADAAPRGRVTVNTSVSFGTQVLVPLIPRFLAQHPQVALDIVLTDRVVDLMDERADIAIRWGPLPSSDLVARHLGETAQAIVGAPAYLARHGTPRKPADLDSHNRLDFSYRRRVPDWPLLVDGRLIDVPVRGSVRASDGETLRQLAIAGAGLARLSRYHIQADLDAGRLVPVLEKYNPHDMAPIHAVYLGKAGRLPSRVRAVLDFLVANVEVDPRLRSKRAAGNALNSHPC